MYTKRPPLGWNSWNTFGNDISEELLMQTADAMVEKGLKDAGYEYVVIDDCWSLRERDGNGDIVTDPVKFPHGMKYLSDYIHSKGLKFGMYSCAGVKTCAGYPSSYHNEFRDAKLFASFGIDFLKYDFCNVPAGSNGPLLYHTMGMALKESGRDILFSACNWGSDHVETWIRSCGAGMYPVAVAATVMTVLCLEMMHFFHLRYGEKVVELTIVSDGNKDLITVLDTLKTAGINVETYSIFGHKIHLTIRLDVKNYVDTLRSLVAMLDGFQIEDLN